MGEVREGATLRRHNPAGTSTWGILRGMKWDLLSTVVPAGCLLSFIAWFKLSLANSFFSYCLLIPTFRQTEFQQPMIGLRCGRIRQAALGFMALTWQSTLIHV